MDSLIFMISKTRFPVQSGVQSKEQNNQAHHKNKKDLVFPMCAKSWSFYFLTLCFVNKWGFLNWV